MSSEKVEKARTKKRLEPEPASLDAHENFNADITAILTGCLIYVFGFAADSFSELGNTERNKGDKIKYRAYMKAVHSLSHYPKRVTSVSTKDATQNTNAYLCIGKRSCTARRSRCQDRKEDWWNTGVLFIMVYELALIHHTIGLWHVKACRRGKIWWDHSSNQPTLQSVR